LPIIFLKSLFYFMGDAPESTRWLLNSVVKLIGVLTMF